MKTTLLLTRHGKTEWNLLHKIQGHTDIPLHPIGIEETKKSAQKLKHIPIHRIYTSTLSRAAHTGDILAQELSITNIHRRDDLRERSFGPYEGWHRDMVHEEFLKKEIDFFTAEIEGVEKHTDFLTRSMNALSSIATTHPGETILVAWHAGNISVVLSQLAPYLLSNGIVNNALYRYEFEIQQISEIS